MFIHIGYGGQGGGGKIGHHKIGMSAYMGQNRMRGDGGPKNSKNVGHHLCTFPYTESFT